MTGDITLLPHDRSTSAVLCTSCRMLCYSRLSNMHAARAVMPVCMQDVEPGRGSEWEAHCYFQVNLQDEQPGVDITGRNWMRIRLTSCSEHGACLAVRYSWYHPWQLATIYCARRAECWPTGLLSNYSVTQTPIHAQQSTNVAAGDTHLPRMASSSCSVSLSQVIDVTKHRVLIHQLVTFCGRHTHPQQCNLLLLVRVSAQGASRAACDSCAFSCINWAFSYSSLSTC